jgi:hypothetical protein
VANEGKLLAIVAHNLQRLSSVRCAGIPLVATLRSSEKSPASTPVWC